NDFPAKSFLDKYEKDLYLQQSEAAQFRLLTGKDLPTFIPIQDLDTGVNASNVQAVVKLIGGLKPESHQRVASNISNLFRGQFTNAQIALNNAGSGGDLSTALHHWAQLLQTRRNDDNNAQAAQSTLNTAKKDLDDALARAKTNGWQGVYHYYTNVQQ